MNQAVYIGLGSNLGNRHENLATARRVISGIDGIDIIAESSILETEPVEYTQQPFFLNQILRVATSLPPHTLLRELLRVEEEMGRTRDIPKGPRIIDCDLLLYGIMIISTEGLTLPHPGIMSRPFILRHLVELDTTLRDPVTGRYYREELK